jgi:hypothetical protein
VSSASIDTSPGRHHTVGLLSLPAHKRVLWLSVTWERALIKNCGPPANSPSRCQRALGSRTRSYIRPCTRPPAEHLRKAGAKVLPVRSAAEQMPQRLIQAGMAKSVTGLLQPGRQHPLIGAGEFARTLLAEQ